MSLGRYRKIRDFARTREPIGKGRPKAGQSYVIQKHDASHLHYDFRLELGGVLLSWAVPKGPSLDPRVKRLAVQTEDHPIEYGRFEGTIPEGAYGGGTVMVWDRGTWEPEGDPKRAYKAGRLSFQLHGEKLTGGWHLVKTQRGGEKQKSWLLFKAADEAARPGDTSLLEEHQDSVLSGRGMSAIATGSPRKARVRRGNAPIAGAVRAPIAGAVRAPMPTAIEPELATLVSEVPSGADFMHEVKFDGYRILARIEKGRVTLLTRNGEDWTERMPSLARALGALKLKSGVLDGEFVALDERGVSDFQLLQNSFHGDSTAPLAYYAFDLLYLNGDDLRGAELLARKEALKQLLPKGKASVVRYSAHTVGAGRDFFAKAAELGLEGVVSKRVGSSYRAGRGRDWLKSKSLARQEFLIVGYTDPGGARAHLGALLLGVRKAGKLVYAGRVGTGFNEASLAELERRLTPLATKAHALENAPRGAAIRGVHWVKPALVAEVAYTAITQGGLLRHPTFKGLREDKKPSDIVLEAPRRPAARRKVAAGTKSNRVAGVAPAAPTLSHPDKVLYPELGLTKRELFDYFALVSDAMLPHVQNRPLTLLRCPEGRAKPCFFQKHPGKSLAAGLRRVNVPASDGQGEYAAIEDARGLQALVQAGALEVHIWGALANDPGHPDRLVFDLDPDPELKFSQVIAGARALRALLDELGLQSFIKTTGGKGLHITVPIEAGPGWDDVKKFCQAVAQELARRDPTRYVATMSKAKRSGKIFVDYLRNTRGATFVAPYSPRARPGAPIAMPVEWDELSAQFTPEPYTVRSAEKYLARRATDPFRKLLRARQQLPDFAPPLGSASRR